MNNTKYVAFSPAFGQEIISTVETVKKYFPKPDKNKPQISPMTTGIIYASIGSYNATDKQYGWSRVRIDDSDNIMEGAASWGLVAESATTEYAVEATGKNFCYANSIVQLFPAEDKNCYLFIDSQVKAYGKLDAELAKGSHATCSIYTSIGDTGSEVEVYEHLLPSGGTIAADTYIYLEWFASEQKWFVTGVACG